MKNYVARLTADRYGRKAGNYVSDGQLMRDTPDISSAYVFNTRMNRRNAPHLMTDADMADWCIEIVYVTLTPEAPQ